MLARAILVQAPSKNFSIPKAQVRCHIFIKNLRLALKSDLQSGETFRESAGPEVISSSSILKAGPIFLVSSSARRFVARCSPVQPTLSQGDSPSRLACV